MAGEESKKKLDLAAEEAVKVIALAAENAIKVVANATAEAVKIRDTGRANDHDTIVMLVGSVENLDKKFSAQFLELKEGIKDLKDGLSHRVDNLEQLKLNTADSYPVLYKAGVEKAIEDHETRIRINTDRIIRVMTWGSILIFLIGIAEPIILKFWK